MFSYPSDLFCYRIIEIFWLEKTFKSPIIHPSVQCPPIKHCASPTHLLSIFGAGDSPTSMCSLFHCLTELLVKIFFLIHSNRFMVQLQPIFPLSCHSRGENDTQNSTMWQLQPIQDLALLVVYTFLLTILSTENCPMRLLLQLQEQFIESVGFSHVASSELTRLSGLIRYQGRVDKES